MHFTLTFALHRLSFACTSFNITPQMNRNGFQVAYLKWAAKQMSTVCYGLQCSITAWASQLQMRPCVCESVLHT